jgi:hypothetical protein
LRFPAAGVASGSEIIDRNAQSVRLSVDGGGRALVSYRYTARACTSWPGAAIDRATTDERPTAGRLPQGLFRTRVASFRNDCRSYDGPKLAFMVAACAAPDGSYWALQSWRRTLPNFDGKPRPGLGASELHLSHWSGPIATLEAWTDWVYGGRYHHLFGRLTYDGKPVYGFTANRAGSPRDGYGRNIYVDTFNSRYGKGWRRENAFLATGRRASSATASIRSPRGAGERREVPPHRDRARRHAGREYHAARSARLRRQERRRRRVRAPAERLAGLDRVRRQEVPRSLSEQLEQPRSVCRRRRFVLVPKVREDRNIDFP